MIRLHRAKQLKTALVDFVLDAEDGLAKALEWFSAAQMIKTPQTDLYRRDFVVDRFSIEGQAGSHTPIDLFIESCPDLSPSDRLLLKGWQRSFMGLFAISQVRVDGFELTNWTTAKRYIVKLSETELQAASKLKVTDIILTQIAPVSESKHEFSDQDNRQHIDEWMLYSKWITLGKLGKPKLAVAIGNFRQNYRTHLYSDAPELLEEAWKSVEKYHQNFLDFFGSNEITMSGYHLNQQLAEFQEAATQKQLEASGLDQSKSLQTLATEAGISQAEIEETAAALGADSKMVDQILEGKTLTKMMAPSIELPPHLKKAEQVTVLTDPRSGQVFLPHYSQFKANLKGLEPEASLDSLDPTVVALVQKYLSDPEVPAFVWHRLAQDEPVALEKMLQVVLEQPKFELTQLDVLLEASGKVLQPELPEIASVPIHLHTLFQEAVLEVSKERPKKKPAAKSGFQRA